MHFLLSEALPDIRPQEAIDVLKRYVLIDGLGLVVDLERSQGSRFYDAASNRPLIDMYSFYGSMPVGFNHPYFEQPAVRDELLQAALTKVANSDVYSAAYARFVRTFDRVVGVAGMGRYFFIEGGAPAVENALKAAMDWKVRRNIAAGRGEVGTDVLHFRFAFHGRTGYALSLTNTDPNKIRYFARLDWPRVSSPALDFTLPEPQRSEKAAADERNAEEEIRRVLAERPHRLCAIIIEPVQAEGGDRHFRGEFLRTLRRICDENELLLIFDEVQTGMGASGRNWCFEHFGVQPDLVAFGKKSQVCGVIAGPRLDEVPENVFHVSGRINSTWGGNLCDMVRATHYLNIIEQERLVENAARQGRYFLERLSALAADWPLVTAVRGRGLLLAFDLPDATTRDRFWKGCCELGLLVVRCGERSIRLRGVLDVRPDVIDEAVDIMRRQLARMDGR